MFFLPDMVTLLPTIAPLTMIAGFFAIFYDFFAPVFKLLMRLFELIPLLLSPTELANEILSGIVIGFTLFIEKLFGYINPAYYQDKLKNSSENNIDTVETNCYSTSFMSILLLIVCPPFAVWQTYGISGFKEVILCTLLTVYGYYFPGLIYALLITEAVNKNRKRCKD